MTDPALIAYSKRKEEMTKEVRAYFKDFSWIADGHYAEPIAEFVLKKLGKGLNSGWSLGQ